MASFEKVSPLPNCGGATLIKAIIIDDEVHCINRLAELLKEYCEENICLVGCFQTIEKGITGILKSQPDLVFLDVQIKDKTGFDLLKELHEINFEIFTTAYEKYAVQAFKFSAIDYLLKPVDADDLVSDVNKVNKKISGAEISQKINTLFHNLKNNKVSQKISIPTLDGLIFLELYWIFYGKLNMYHLSSGWQPFTKYRYNILLRK